MRKFLLFMTAAFAFAAVSCSEDNKEVQGNGELAAPEVSFKSVTSTSFTAEWPAVKGADSYRYEVTYLDGGRPVAVAAKNLGETTFSLEALKPATEYIVRVVAKAGEKMSTNWYTGNVSTSGSSDVTFNVTPYEQYYKNEGYVYPYAHVEVSNPDVYYWVSAVPVASLDKARDWMEEDIAYYIDLGATWDELVEEKLILKGNGESSPFVFNGYDHYQFVVAQIEKNLDGISITPNMAYSHQFWSEGTDVTMLHECTYENYVGDWVVQTFGTVRDEGGKLEVKEGESFPVKISASSDKKTLDLTGWGGSRNKFSNAALKLDFELADDNYSTIGISFPQEIKKEGEIVWKYVSWYYFTAGDQVRYLPYDDKMAETMPSWKKGFSGFIGNLNRTVIKIFPEDYTDPTSGEGASMMAIWPYGISTTGDTSKDQFLTGKYEEPSAFYFLTRKDVADGKKLELPDTSVPEQSSVSVNSFSWQDVVDNGGRAFRRLIDSSL